MNIIENLKNKPIIEEKDQGNLPDAVLCRVTYNICNLGERNANNRIYERGVFDKVLADETLQEMIQNRRLFGQAEHPTETQSDLQLTSHVIHKMWMDENNVWQTMDVLDTPMGRIVDSLIRAECGVGVSTRAEGDLEESEDDTGKFSRVIPESYVYRTTDFTADPSTFGVLPASIKRNVLPTVQAEMENKSATSAERDFAKQLFESISKTEESKESKTTVESLLKEDKIKEGTELLYGDQEVKIIKIDEGRVLVGLPGKEGDIAIEGAEVATIEVDSGKVHVWPKEEMDIDVPEAEPVGDFEPEMEEKKETKETVSHKGRIVITKDDLKFADSEDLQRFRKMMELDRADLEDGLTLEDLEEKCSKSHPKKKKMKEGMDQLVARKEELLAKKEAGKCTEDERKELVDIESKLKDMDVDIEEKSLPTEGGVSSKVAQGNVLKKGEETWIVKNSDASGVTVTQPGEPASEKHISWESLDDEDFVKIGEKVEITEGFDVGDIVQIKDKEGNTTVVPEATVAKKEEQQEGVMAVEVTGSDNEDEMQWYSEDEYQIIPLNRKKWESKVDESIDEGFKTDLRNKDKAAIKKRISNITDKILAGEKVSSSDKRYWEDFHTAVEKVKGDEPKNESVNEAKDGFLWSDPISGAKYELTKDDDGYIIYADEQEILTTKGGGVKIIDEFQVGDGFINILSETGSHQYSESKESKLIKEQSDEGTVYRFSSSSGYDYVASFKEDGSFTIEDEENVLAQGTWSGAGVTKVGINDPIKIINFLQELLFDGGYEERPIESKDIKIQEAISRAEKEKALETIEELSNELDSQKNESSDSKLRLKMLMKKMKESLQVYDEVSALRTKLEEKAKEAHSLRESLEESKSKLDEEKKKGKEQILTISETHKNKVNAIVESNQNRIKIVKEEYEEIVEESKALGITEGKSKVLSEYIDRRLAEIGLSIGENTRALLDGCESIGDVEDILEKTKDIQRRNALHSEGIKEVRIRNHRQIDPEQARVKDDVDNALDGMM